MVLRGGIFLFDRRLGRLGDEGDLGGLGAVLVARFLGSGDDEGISTVKVRVLPPLTGRGALAGSFRFLDGAPCSALAVPNDALPPALESNSRGGGNVDGDWECEPCGDEAFPNLAAILCFSPWLLGSQVGYILSGFCPL